MITLDPKAANQTLASLRRAQVVGTSVWLFEPRGLVDGAGTAIARAAVITMPDQSASVVPVPRRAAGIGFAILVLAFLGTLLTGRWMAALALIVTIVGVYALLYRISAPAIRQNLITSGVLVVKSHP